MPSSLLDFVSAAVRNSVECSITELRQIPDFQKLGALEVVRKIEEVCATAAIECHPSLSLGELDDARVFSARKNEDAFRAAFEQARNAGEGHCVEFKQTLGLNVRRHENDPNAAQAELFEDQIVHEVVKSIVAFLNADGGILLIGVRDDGSAYGIQNEYAFVGGNKSRDQWELRLNSVLQAFILDYKLLLGYVRYTVMEVDGCCICTVIVEPRRDRICVCRKSNAAGSDEIVYRRSGNQSPRLQARDVEALVLDRVRKGLMG